MSIESLEAVEEVFQKTVLVPAREVQAKPDETYSPTRLEYFSAMILSALLIGRSVKDQQKCVAQSLVFAKDMLEALDG